MTKCKKDGCQKEAAPNQVYCSRDCAPYGRLSGPGTSSSNTNLRNKMTRAEKDAKAAQIRDLAERGLTSREISDRLKYSIHTVREYAHAYGFKFRTDRAPKKKAG